ncbi:META domain-containing protein [Streptomyces sp. enrichment culture]|uniref:META domain-containing protein n=1 Tax=Streptomyces sp. enrichment culture TaxID=1795815 RepID=UPI003F55440B
MRITKCLLPVLAVTATATALAGCSNGTTPGDRPDIPLTGTHWTLDALTVEGARKTAPAPRRAYVEFKPDGTATGNAGCNGFTAKAAISGDTVTVGEVTRTEMACDKAVQDFEDAFLTAFTGKLQAKLGDRDVAPASDVGTARLTLTTSGGDTLALSERPPAPLKGTKWSVETLLDGQTASSLPAGVKNRPHLTIAADGSATGNLGCNNFTATVKDDGDKLTFDALAVTRRMCTTLQNGLEQKLYGTLGSGPVTYRIEDGRLTVTAQDGSGFGAVATAP